jgi:hypothetical protein
MSFLIRQGWPHLRPNLPLGRFGRTVGSLDRKLTGNVGRNGARRSFFWGFSDQLETTA